MAADPANLREILAACREHGVSVAHFAPDGSPVRLEFGPRPTSKAESQPESPAMGEGSRGQPLFPAGEEGPSDLQHLLRGQPPGLVAALRRRLEGIREPGDEVPVEGPS